jgi:hypothetical protein
MVVAHHFVKGLAEMVILVALAAHTHAHGTLVGNLVEL